MTSYTLQGSLLAGVAMLTLAVAGQARAAGFYLEDQSTKASGRAFSGEAADMGAESLWYNPASIAGITQSEMSGSITPIFTDSRVSNSGSTITQGGVTRPIAGEQTAFKPVELGVIPASASSNTPWAATFSVRWQMTDKLALEGQGVRFGWSDFQQIALNSPGGLLPNQLQNYHDTTSGALGFDYAVTKKLTVRGGVQYDPTPTPDDGRDARVPDGDRFLFAGGYSYKVTPHIVLDGAISYVDFIPSHINRDASEYGNISPALNVPVNIQGEVNASAVTMSVGGRIYF